jgi:hypothetical protein
MRTFLFLALLGLCAGPAAASEDTRTERVQFERGADGATLKGRIKGYGTAHYLLGAKAGQSMTVVLTTDNSASYFNVFAPGAKPGRDAAMFIGSTKGNRYQGELPADGDYLIQVYMMRSAARRDEVANYSLTVKIEGAGAATTGAATKTVGDAIDWPRDTDASGHLPCSAGEPGFKRECPFRVRRNRYGATVWTFKPGSAKDLRVLYFESDAFSTDDATKLDWNRRSDNWWVGAGGREFYLIPDAVIRGG